MKPVIGLSSNSRRDSVDPWRSQIYLDAVYLDAVEAAGGLPVALPVPQTPDPALLDELIAACDGLVFTGGFDLHPHHFGDEPVHPKAIVLDERRDRFEVELFRRADAARLPILAICLGHQIAHVARGGALIQHIDDLDRPTPVTHYLASGHPALHSVRIEPGSRLASVVGGTEIEVNSRHHQAVDHRRPVHNLRPVAWSPDGLLEGAEDCDGRFLLCVQWHPEDLFDRPEHLRLFEAVVHEARAWRTQRRS
ncbi:MAG: gamma-glutamyl-gamma-aminobutyrate hydrolase family protein [Phycisphaerae bacterium]|jgi:putative glutamine amidotransferase